jgi:hypothetical protein
METEDLEDFHHFIMEEISRRSYNVENKNSEEDSSSSETETESVSVLTWKSPSPTSTASKPTNKKASAKGKIVEKADKTADEVYGIEMVVGPRPMCMCQMPSQIHVSHTSKNPDRMFFRCMKEQGTQCRFFQWCMVQPLQDVTSWKYRQQPGEPAKTDFEVLTKIVQDACPHMKTHGKGSNGSVRKTTCCSCNKLLAEFPNPKATSSSTTLEKEFAEFKEYMKRKDRK